MKHEKEKKKKKEGKKGYILLLCCKQTNAIRDEVWEFLEQDQEARDQEKRVEPYTLHQPIGHY